jgi:hypothetical protein
MADKQSIEVDLSQAHRQMLDELRETHEGDIDVFLRQQLEEQIHKSYQQTQYGGE